MDNQSIASLDEKRKQAQQDYVIQMAAEKSMTMEQLETHILHDICAGVPTEETANILTNMFHACQRVTAP